MKREDGLDFREMAVIVRDADHYIPLISATFEKLGIPYYVRESLPLARTPPGRSLLALLHLPECNYRRFDVMDWLTQGAISPSALTSGGSPAPLSLWDRMSIEAGVVESLQQWGDRLRALGEAYRRRAESRPEEERAGLGYLRNEAEELRSFLEGVFAKLDRLSRQTTWRDLVEQAVDLLCDYHQPSTQRDEVQDAIDSLRSLDTLGQPAEFPLFLNLLEKVLLSTSEKRGELSKTGIHLLSLTAGRHTRFRVVFLPGLTERSFPLQGRQDPVLLDFEREQLSSLSTWAHLPLKRGRPVEERLLFLIALEAAGERLILSFPRSDAVSGAHWVPSYYALKAIECLTDHSITFEDLSRRNALDPRVRHIGDARILSVELQTCMDRREFDLGTVRRCLASAHPGTARYLEYLAPAFGRSVQAEQAQWGSRTLGPYDGLLSSPSCQERLAEIFGGTRVFSPTALERYASCPYHLFLADVLGLEVLEEPEAIESLEPKELGTLVHQILRDFYERMKAERKLPLAQGHFNQYRTVLDEICQRQFAETEAKGITGYPLMWELTRKFIRQDLERHLLAEMDRDLDWVPQDFERGFGFRGDSPCVEYALNGEVLHLRGKIDRIDLSPDGRSVRVMDYKTGKRYTPGTVGLAGGTMLQLPLYLQASVGFYPEADLEASSAEYCYVRRAGSWKPSIFKGSSLREKSEAIQNILATILVGCRQGLFPRHPENHSYPQCSDCDFELIGDPRRDTLWERKRSDPCLAEFLKMREIK